MPLGNSLEQGKYYLIKKFRLCEWTFLGNVFPKLVSIQIGIIHGEGLWLQNIPEMKFVSLNIFKIYQ